MSVLRAFNWLGSQRVDVSHLRLIDASVAGDFDTLAGVMLAGKQPLIIQGWTVPSAGIGGLATSLQLVVANAALIHYNASESGSIYAVPASQAAETLSSTNPSVIGAFSNSVDNYVGIDLTRSVDNTTNDAVSFLAANTVTDTSRSTPLARTLKYQVVISSKSFSSAPNVAPIAIIAVDANGNVTKITDSRKMFFRLGSGGDVPNGQSTYSFSQRTDPAQFTTSAGTNPFVGGDKDLASLKNSLDAIMTRLWDATAAETWFGYGSPAQNIVLLRTGVTTFSNSDYFEIQGGTDVHWRGLSFIFGNSTAITNTIADRLTSSAGLTDLAVGQCVYVDIQRDTDGATLTAYKGTLASLGEGTRPGSRYPFIWRTSAGWFSRGSSLAIGTSFPVATTSALGIVKLSVTSGTPSAPVVIAIDEKSVASGVTALDASSRALAQGLTRITSGTLTIGNQANDTAVAIGQGGVNTNILGTTSVVSLDTPSAAQLVLAPTNATSIGASSKQIKSVAEPTGAQDAATKNYSDTRWGSYASLYRDGNTLGDSDLSMAITATWTKVTFPHGSNTTGSIITNDNAGRLTATVAGDYRIAASLTFVLQASATVRLEDIFIAVYKNGTAVQTLFECAFESGSNSNSIRAVGSGEIKLTLAANDYIEIFYNASNNGGALTLNNRFASLVMQRVA